jgi:hypothetical protein
MRLDLTPLFIVQPKQIAPHGLHSESQGERISNRFSQQCFYWVLTLVGRTAILSNASLEFALEIGVLIEGRLAHGTNLVNGRRNRVSHSIILGTFSMLPQKRHQARKLGRDTGSGGCDNLRYFFVHISHPNMHFSL